MTINFCSNSLVLYFLCLLYFVTLSNAGTFDYPSANLSTSWRNSPSLPHSVEFTDGSTVRAILLRGTFGPRFACGFFCNGTCDSYLFAIFIVQTNSASYITSPAIGFPQVVWSANRNNPVRINATLQFTSGGDLILKDVDGTIAWSTNTADKSVAGLNLTDMGNLVLFDDKDRVVWQSFDHPTDSLVPGQKLVSGKKLIPSVSATNWTQLSLLLISVTDEGMFASVESNPPQVYEELQVYGKKTNREPTYVTLRNGSFALFANSSEPSEPDMFVNVPQASSTQYARFFADGHLRVYEWGTNGWTVVADLLSSPGYECFYPTVCGNYGICSDRQCSCPSTAYFKQITDRQPNLGCSAITPLSCGASQNHSFLELKDTTYSSFQADLQNVDSESCKMACLKNCSCKAAIFQYGSDSANGFCYMPNEIFSLMNNDKEKTHYNSTVYLKVQDAPKLPNVPVV
ncbi:EP1-like glycoprotein 4 [Ricinus communis]|uniref:S-locus-specific glycoprotein, putative n=1 Tax=Ricinus communis TaxID=3988 RepID=B9SIR0_RICCO|nr:EP1-like glycoprotein 4 [Ricinus communis]EEF36483.1 S-locus-specific glycoprotein precursor, putative [Ricinus communis]|eukprot:XP_002525879.1 EP1-like glycoprotein 4 [Ricinus communis]